MVVLLDLVPAAELAPDRSVKMVVKLVAVLWLAIDCYCSFDHLPVLALNHRRS